jgi:pullulanase
MHAGMEMHRSKGGHHDSYRSPDEVNQIEWSRKAEFEGLYLFSRNCIELRRQHPAFRMCESKMVREKLIYFQKYIPGIISYQLIDHANGDSWRTILVLFNGNNYSVEIEITEKKWLIVAQNGQLQPHGMGYVTTSIVRLHPISMMILAEE